MIPINLLGNLSKAHIAIRPNNKVKNIFNPNENPSAYWNRLNGI